MTDFRRIFQVDKATCDPNHRFARFLTGNQMKIRENVVTFMISIQDLRNSS